MNPMSLLTVAEASVEIGIPVDDLDRLRRDGRGPKHLSIAEAGQILYRRYDLLEWVKPTRHAPAPPPETEWTENDECHAALGYVAAELARLTGRGTHEVMNEARKVVREENARIVPVPIAPPRREP